MKGGSKHSQKMLITSMYYVSLPKNYQLTNPGSENLQNFDFQGMFLCEYVGLSNMQDICDIYCPKVSFKCKGSHLKALF